MKKKTYNILSKIPFVGLIVQIKYHPVLMCSPGMSEGIYDSILEYMEKHPDELMTFKLAKKIWSEKNNSQ